MYCNSPIDRKPFYSSIDLDVKPLGHSCRYCGQIESFLMCLKHGHFKCKPLKVSLCLHKCVLYEVSLVTKDVKNALLHNVTLTQSLSLYLVCHVHVNTLPDQMLQVISVYLSDRKSPEF